MHLLSMERWETPLRTAAGSFILNSGLSKRGMPEEAAEGVQQFASSTELPVIEDLEPKTFVDTLSTAEIALGTALLLPMVPRRLAGLGLTAFAAGLVRLYWKAPGARQEGDVRPTEEGQGLAKDVWLLAMGLALLLGGDEDKGRDDHEDGKGRRGRLRRS